MQRISEITISLVVSGILFPPFAARASDSSSLIAADTTIDVSSIEPTENLATVSTSDHGAGASDSGSWRPHPYLDGGLSLSRGAGYSPAAGIVGGGLNIDNRHLVLLTEAYAQNAHKIDSNTGTEVGIQTRTFTAIHSGWFLGAGAQWSELNTRPYTKSAWRPTVGGAKDIVHERLSMWIQTLYIFPGTDHLNALQGPEVSVWFPSPSSKSHLFYRQNFGIYEFHQTSVPGNSGTNQRMVSTFIDFTLLYRF